MMTTMMMNKGTPVTLDVLEDLLATASSPSTTSTLLSSALLTSASPKSGEKLSLPPIQTKKDEPIVFGKLETLQAPFPEIHELCRPKDVKGTEEKGTLVDVFGFDRFALFLGFHALLFFSDLQKLVRRKLNSINSLEMVSFSLQTDLFLSRPSRRFWNEAFRCFKRSPKHENGRKSTS